LSEWFVIASLPVVVVVVGAKSVMFVSSTNDGERWTRSREGLVIDVLVLVLISGPLVALTLAHNRATTPPVVVSSLH
jgi:hypothetical protein